MNEPIILHDYWRSSASYRVRIALGLKQLSWRAIPVDLVKGGHRAPEFTRVNPQGLVPALEIDGHCLTQSVAILEYLDETRPDPALLPPDPAGRARVRALAHVIAMEVHPVNNLRILEHVDTLTRGGMQARVDWLRHFMPQGLVAFEALLDHPATGRFCHGDAPGLADLCLVPQVYNARRWEIDLTPCPRLVEIAAACEALPAFAAAHPDRHRPAPE